MSLGLKQFVDGRLGDVSILRDHPCRPVIDFLLDRLPLEVADQRPYGLIAHLHRVLHDQTLMSPLFQGREQLRVVVVSDKHSLPAVLAGSRKASSIASVVSSLTVKNAVGLRAKFLKQFDGRFLAQVVRAWAY